ncbi:MULTISPECIES: hypothetical protein [Sinorhizobium]|uniref:phage adaptor protein n=1 Tax=Sinorhizobium TaxID=28105 RepID=UPI000BE7D72A|nr:MULTISPECIES: hypothetical protein [Sinorhizobium]PDT54700.1 hypothetical protein CO664_06210 [Sinorhizobium sp. NG07B]POH31744.1 hypothetical protein ATY30_09895 [Sinorhizobium americanum]
MTLFDYASLLVDAGDYSGRDDVAHLFPRFLALAELKLNRVMRVADMEKTVAVPLTEGEGRLPADFLEARQVLAASGRALRALPLQELSNHVTSDGAPIGYAIVGSAIQVRPKRGENIQLTYYGKIPPLTAGAPGNWLIERAPDVYLYALVEVIAIWERDAAKAGAAEALKRQAMAGLGLADERLRFGNAAIVIGGLTP